MRLVRWVSVFGLFALLLGSAVAVPAWAAPSDQGPGDGHFNGQGPDGGRPDGGRPDGGRFDGGGRRGWDQLGRPGWDHDQDWFRQSITVPVTGPFTAQVPVTVLAPTGVVDGFAAPAFTNTFQQVIVPSLVTVVPASVIQNGIQVVEVSPNLYALAAPQFYCAPDAAGNCQAMATQLVASAPGWTTVTANGPLGYGVYVAYQV